MKKVLLFILIATAMVACKKDVQLPQQQSLGKNY